MYKVYIKTDGQNNITAVDSDAFLPSPIPEGWMQIDEGVGDKYHHAQGNYFDGPLISETGKYRYKYAGGAVTENDVSPTLDELKAAKRAEIWGAGDAILAQVKSNFTAAEIEAWPKQEQGAKDIQAGNTDTDSAKFVAGIAAQRGMATETLVAKIMGHVETYAALSATVIGEQQRLDDMIKTATTQEQLDAIVWTLDPFAEEE